MNLLPLVGLVAGFLIGDRRSLLVIAALGGMGLSLVAIFTEEIDGWADPYVWGLMVVSLLAAMLGIALCRWITTRRTTRPE